MKIVVLNVSPKGTASVTMQYVQYIQKMFPQHELSTVDIALRRKKIEEIESLLQEIVEQVRAADGVMWAFPLYILAVHANYKRFIELIWERGAEGVFEGKYAASLSTSVHYFDHTAHNYIQAICDDLGMRYAGAFSPDMRDLLKESGRAQTQQFAQRFFDAIWQTEGVDTFALGGQSYGGLLAHAYLASASKPKAVEQLILSSTGPADYGKARLPVESVCIILARLLPEKTVKNLLVGGVLKVITVPEAERAEWVEAVHAVMRHELSRADVVSHFAVAADVIRKDIVTPATYQNWTGRVIVLSAENDPTQSKKDVPLYEKLFGRSVEVLNMGNMGHTAALFNADKYVELLEQTLSDRIPMDVSLLCQS